MSSFEVNKEANPIQYGEQEQTEQVSVEVEAENGYDNPDIPSPTKIGGESTEAIEVNEYETETYEKVSLCNRSTPGAIFNTMNTIIGGGIVGLPYGLKRSGFWLGVFLMILIPFITYYTKCIMINACKKYKVSTYEGLGLKAFGQFGYQSINLSLLFASFFTLVGYLIIIGENLPSIMEFFGAKNVWLDRRLLIFLFAIFPVLPICLIKDISILGYFSAFSMFAVFFIIVSVIIASSQIVNDTVTGPLSGGRISFFAATGTFVFSYSAHALVFQIYESLKVRKARIFRFVSAIAIFFTFLGYFTMALVAYLTFRDNIVDNVINSFSNKSKLITATRFVFSFSIMLTFPMFHSNVRYLIHCLFFRKNKHESSDPTNLQHYIISFFVQAGATSFSFFMNKLSTVLELVGSTTIVYYGFLMPVMLYWKVKGPRNLNQLLLREQKDFSTPPTTKQIVLNIINQSFCAFIFIMGVMVFILGSIFAFIKIK